MPASSPGQFSSSEQPAAVLVFPLLRLDRANGIDTLLRLANATDEPVDVHCFTGDESRRCSIDFTPCVDTCPDPEASCLPAGVVTDFLIRLTPFQPIAWLLGDGLGPNEFPLDGLLRVGPDGSSNAGSDIPPAPVDPFVGWMQCFAVDSNLNAVESNSLTGAAALYEEGAEHVDAAEYGAIGIRALSGASNGDAVLLIGSEYTGCSSIVSFEHFFDGAVDPASGSASIETRLALAPCTAALDAFVFDDPAIEYLVFNEFAQRFVHRGSRLGTMRGSLSRMDGQRRETSPFFAGVAGTLTGKTLLRSRSSGVLGIAVEERADAAAPERRSRAAFNLHGRGVRSSVDRIFLP